LDHFSLFSAILAILANLAPWTMVHSICLADFVRLAIFAISLFGIFGLLKLFGPFYTLVLGYFAHLGLFIGQLHLLL
jgi:hypothetical protein